MNFKTLPILILLSMGAATRWACAQNDHYPQFMEMGNRALAAQKYDLAVDYYQSAIDDKSDCWQAYVGLGNCYYYEKKLKESLQAYEKAFKINPDNQDLVKFIQFLKKKMGLALPTPTPIPLSTPVPAVAPPPQTLPGLSLPPPPGALPPK